MQSTGNITHAYELRHAPKDSGLEEMHQYGIIDNKYCFFSHSGGEKLQQGALVKFTPSTTDKPWTCQCATQISPAIDRSATIVADAEPPQDRFAQRLAGRDKSAGPTIK
jgi:hypothetical protein